VEDGMAVAHRAVPGAANYFQRYTLTSTHGGTRGGKPRNKMVVLATMGRNKYRIEVLMLAGEVLPRAVHHH
jgi:hypothetical protein